MSYECATATLRESLASGLQMSGGPSNGSRSSTTPVTDREAAESEQSTPLGTESPLKKTRPTKFDSVYTKNCPWNRYLARNGPPNSQTRAPTQAVNASKSSTSDDWQQACTTGNVSTSTSHLWTDTVHRLKLFTIITIIINRLKPTIIRTTGAGALSSSTAKIQSP